MFYIKNLKPIFEILISIILLIILIPIFIIVSLGIFLDSGSPIIFRQKRIGMGNIEFYLYKFRTMPIDTKEIMSSKANDLKINKFGKLLRRLSIDELPQLINILKGEMSLIGPRPILVSMKEMSEKRKHLKINSLKPGITGLAQINGHDEMTEQEKIDYDLKYLQSVSIIFDLKILLFTILYIFKTPPTD